MAEELQDAPWLNDLPDAPWAAKPSIAADIAKSGGIGLVRGGIGLAGAPGDITTGLSGGSDWLRSKLVDYGLLSPERAERARKAEAASNQQMTLPTSQGIRGAIEQRTGPFYEPKTRAGRYAESAGEFVPGAMLGGGDLLTNAVRFGVLPGLASHGAQEATQGTGLEPYAQAAAALGVGGIGALATQPRTAERFLRAQLPDYVTQQSINDADSLIRDANARGVNLTWPEALSQVTGQPVLNDMQRILEGSKQTRATMQQTLGDRPAEIAQAGGNIAAGIAPRNWEPSTIGGQVGQAAEAVTNEAREAINKLSEPYYKRAENVRISPQQMQQVQALPGWDEAVKAVRGDPQLNRYVATLPANSVGFLNEVKKYLDQQAENAASPLYQQRNMQRSAGYGRDAAAVRGIGVNASVDYATALAVQAHSRETYLDPLMRGPLGQLAKKNNTTKQAIDALFPSQPLAGSANEVRTAVQELSGQNPDIARQLVRAHVEAKLNEAFDAAGRSPEAAGFAGATFAQRISGNPLIETARGQNFRAAVEALRGPQVWPGIERFLDIARATGWRQPIGSKTAFNEAELHGMASGKLVGNIAKSAASPGEWWHAAHELWGKWQTGNNLGDLARIITDPRSAGVFRRINSMPTGQAITTLTRLTSAVALGHTAEARTAPLRVTVHPSQESSQQPH